MPDREPEPSSRERCNPSQLFAAPPGEAGTYGAMRLPSASSSSGIRSPVSGVSFANSESLSDFPLAKGKVCAALESRDLQSVSRLCPPWLRLSGRARGACPPPRSRDTVLTRYWKDELRDPFRARPAEAAAREEPGARADQEAGAG